MQQALLIVDVQSSFSPPIWLVEKIAQLDTSMHSIATVEHHNESVTPLWQPAWLEAGTQRRSTYCHRPSVHKTRLYATIGTRRLCQEYRCRRVLSCGIQADTCCLAAGFMLFDAGLRPTLLKWLTIGSSLDRSAQLGTSLWRHHFGQERIIETKNELSS